MRRQALAVLLAVGCSGTPQVPAAPRQWVTDAIGLLSPEARQQIDGQLRDYEQKTGHQVIVWIEQSTHGEPVESYAMRLFNDWGIGRRDFDDGIVLFVFTRDDIRRIQVGWGLESALTDRECVRIIREEIRPLIHAGRPDDAVRRGVAAIISEINKWEGRE